jgi:uncharacterized tellurite resistance protein B-like protein
MFAQILSRLAAPSNDRLPLLQERRALAALLVRVGRADDHYGPTEMRRIDQVLAGRFGLSPFEAAGLRADGEALETEAPDTVRFTRALKDHVPLEERAGLIEALWVIALADGERAADEEQLIRLVANLLAVSDAESGLARQRAARA